MTKDEALKLALEALTEVTGWLWAGPMRVMDEAEYAITAIKQVLEQPEPEPVAWLHKQGNFTEACMNALHDDEIDRGWTQQPLYTAPPKREWVGLTREEIDLLLPEIVSGGTFTVINYGRAVARAIEAKLREKNT
jgi:hypothetical protein